VARLRLPLPSTRGNVLTLRLLAHANAPNLTQRVGVRVAGRELAEWTYAALRPDEWREARIPAELVPEGAKEIEVELRIADPGPPPIPGTTDTRALGLGLAAYELGSS
jgi:hypothetical protein